MKILLFGNWRENAGSANVNKSLIQHADAGLDRREKMIYNKHDLREYLSADS